MRVPGLSDRAPPRAASRGLPVVSRGGAPRGRWGRRPAPRRLALRGGARRCGRRRSPRVGPPRLGLAAWWSSSRSSGGGTARASPRRGVSRRSRSRSRSLRRGARGGAARRGVPRGRSGRTSRPGGGRPRRVGTGEGGRAAEEAGSRGRGRGGGRGRGRGGGPRRARARARDDGASGRVRLARSSRLGEEVVLDVLHEHGGVGSRRGGRGARRARAGRPRHPAARGETRRGVPRGRGKGDDTIATQRSKPRHAPGVAARQNHLGRRASRRRRREAGERNAR